MVEKKEEGEVSSLTCVGIIAAPHGVRGQFFLRSYTENPEDIMAYGTLYNASQSQSYDIRLRGTKKDGFIAEIAGVSSREVIEKLRGRKLYVLKDKLPELDEEEFYYTDLVDLKVMCEDNTLYGVVKAVHNYGAGDIIEIILQSTGKTELFPFTKKIIPSVNVADGYVVIQPPEVIIAKEK